MADDSYRFPDGRSLFMRVDLLNDDQRRRVGTHLPFVPALKGGLGPECALKGAYGAEPGLQPTDHTGGRSLCYDVHLITTCA